MLFGVSNETLFSVAATVVVTWAFAALYYKLGKRKKRLAYSVHIANVISRRGDGPSQLRVTYAGEEVASIVRVNVFVWNAGNEAIRREDLETTDKVRIVLSEGLRELEGTVEYQSKPANRVSLLRGGVSFDYLNIRDGFVAEIFAERLNGAAKGSVRVLGEIIGASQPPRKVDFEMHSQVVPPLLMTGLGGTLTGVILYISWQALEKNWDSMTITFSTVIISLFAGAFLGFSALVFLAGCTSLFSRDRIPLDLVRRGKVAKGSGQWLKTMMSRQR